MVVREEAPYVESGSGYTDLNRLTERSDGWLDGVHVIRDLVGAEVVLLVVNRAGVCGITHQAPREVVPENWTGR